MIKKIFFIAICCLTKQTISFSQEQKGPATKRVRKTGLSVNIGTLSAEGRVDYSINEHHKLFLSFGVGYNVLDKSRIHQPQRYMHNYDQGSSPLPPTMLGDLKMWSHLTTVFNYRYYFTPTVSYAPKGGYIGIQARYCSKETGVEDANKAYMLPTSIYAAHAGIEEIIYKDRLYLDLSLGYGCLVNHDYTVAAARPILYVKFGWHIIP